MRFIVIKKRVIFLAAAVALVFAALGAGVSLTDSAQVYLNKTTRKAPIRAVVTADKYVALTFDLGFEAGNAEAAAAVLKSFEVPATFFAVGLWADENEGVVKRLSDAGHEIGTHSNTHPHIIKMTDAQMTLELESSAKTLTRITGKPVELFRAPFGEYSDKLLAVAGGLGLKTVQWDVDTSEFKTAGAAEMSMKVLSDARPGSIILLHTDARAVTEALPLIIEGLRVRGFGFRTVGELLLTAGGA